MKANRIKTKTGWTHDRDGNGRQVESREQVYQKKATLNTLTARMESIGLKRTGRIIERCKPCTQ